MGGDGGGDRGGYDEDDIFRDGEAHPGKHQQAKGDILNIGIHPHKDLFNVNHSAEPWLLPDNERFCFDGGSSLLDPDSNLQCAFAFFVCYGAKFLYMADGVNSEFVKIPFF